MNLNLIDLAHRMPSMSESDKKPKRWKTKREMRDVGGSPGKLHRELGISEGEKIPQDRLDVATRSRDSEIRRDAIRAKTMEGWRHGKRRLATLHDGK